MKQSLIATSLFALWYGVAAFAAAPDESSGRSAEAAAESDPVAQGIGAAHAADSAALESSLDKVNYSLGYELGEDLKRKDLEAVPDAVMKGIEDALSGAKPLVKPKERSAALAEIKSQRAQENLERSRAFLAANAEKEGVKTLSNGLQYKELKPGEGKTPTATSKVTVNYRGTLIDGSEFASSYAQGRPSEFLVKKVIPGWREALPLMKEGAKWELYIPPELAYGKRSPQNRIPPNSALIYEVELLSVDEAPPPPARPAGPPMPPAAAGAKIRDDDE